MRRTLWTHRHSVLLVLSTLMLTVQPLTHGFLIGLVLYDVFLTLMLLAAFVVIFRRRDERTLSLAVGIPIVVTRWIAYGLTGRAQFAFTMLHHGLLAVFFGFAVAIILRAIFHEKTIRTDHVAGTVCGYLFAGIVWGNCYVLAEMINPQSFSVAAPIVWQLDGEHSRSFLFNYFSLCTLSGAGYGDITPIRPFVASLTWLEAVFGQFYIAVVVAQLVGLKLAQSLRTAIARETRSEN